MPKEIEISLVEVSKYLNRNFQNLWPNTSKVLITRLFEQNLLGSTRLDQLRPSWAILLRG